MYYDIANNTVQQKKLKTLKIRTKTLQKFRKINSLNRASETRQRTKV